MTLKKNIMSAGQSAGTASAVCGYVSIVASAGTTYADATLLTNSINKISTGILGSGVRLDLCDVGDEFEITNATAATINVYPSVGSSFISLSANVANELPAGYTARCRKVANAEFSFSIASRIVESGGGGGGIAGNIAATQVAYGSGSDEITGSDEFVVVGGQVGIGTIAPTSKFHVSGSQSVKTTNAATSYTVTSTDHIIRVTDTSAARTITLPTAVGIGGRIYEIKDVSGGAGINNITIDGNGAETIDGAPSVKITIGGGVVRVISNGTNWDLMTPSDYTLDPGVPTAGLVADWNASSLSSVLSNGAFVTSFVDAISSRTLTASGFDRPTFYSAGSPFGGPAIEFGGVDDKLSMALPPGLPDAANPGTIIAIVSGLAVFGVIPTRTIVQYGELFGFGARGLAFNSSKQIQTYDGDHVLIAPSAPTGYGTRVIGHSYTGAVESLFVDGVECASSVVTLTTNNLNFVIGDNVDVAVSPGAFRLMRLLIYNRTLSAGEWRRVMEHARAAHNAF